MEVFNPPDNGNYQVPQIINPQLQLFGGEYEDDGNQYNYFPEDGTMGGMEDGGDAKRRRIARACDMCRKKKIKCDGGMPACKNCINYKTECIFTQVEKKRNPPKGAKYIEGLENRLKRMESLLKLSDLLGDDDDKADLGTLEKRLADKAAAPNRQRETPTKSPGRADSVSQAELLDGQDTMSQDRMASVKDSAPTPSPPQQNKEEDLELLADMMCSLVTNLSGETRFIGASSGLSLFSPKGVSWVNEKVGDDSFTQMIRGLVVTDSEFTYWKPDVFGDIFSRKVYRPLPPLSETLALLKDYFDNFNCMFPLFHEPTFMHLVRQHYSRDPYEGSGWWASLNVVLAIAHRLRVMSHLVPTEEDEKAWGYLKNALAVVAELSMHNTDLFSVQALLGMVRC